MSNFFVNHMLETTIALKFLLFVDIVYMGFKVLYHLKDEGNRSNKRVVITYSLAFLIAIVCFVSSFFVPFRFVFLLCALPMLPVILHRIYIVFLDEKFGNHYDIGDFLGDFPLVAIELFLVALFIKM